jgi:uncharacterized protein (DUF2344 family)
MAKFGPGIVPKMTITNENSLQIGVYNRSGFVDFFLLKKDKKKILKHKYQDFKALL